MTNTASPSRIASWHPVDDADVAGPGTAPTGLFMCLAHAAVLRAPERHPASTRTVAPANPATSRFRVRNLCRAGRIPGGYSVPAVKSLVP